MAERLDVAGRLAEGLPAVEHTQSYVRACAQIGYRHPDLTGDPEQIHDWYASEDGLDLHSLDSDCATLRAAGSLITEALRSQRDQIAVLAAAWTGPGGDAAVAFLRRHCDIADSVVIEVRAAAQRCESLRDNLWQLVDAKVATTVTIDDRTLAQRPAWLAAAATVTAEPSAREIVDQQVKPYVDNDIRQDWRAAMLSARAGVTAAYDMVVDRFAAAPRAQFEMPGDFGPIGRPPRGPIPGMLSPAAVTALPGGSARLIPAPAAATAPMPASAPVPVATPPDSGTGWAGDPGGVGGLGSGSGLGSGGGVGGLGSSGGLGSGGDLGGIGGLGGLVSRIIAGMGDLLGSSAGDPADDLFDDDERLDPDSLEHSEKPKEPRAAAGQEEGAAPAAQPIAGPVTPPAAPPADEHPAPSPLVDPPPNPKPDNPKPAGSTPCEIAASELPQAGQ